MAITFPVTIYPQKARTTTGIDTIHGVKGGAEVQISATVQTAKGLGAIGDGVATEDVALAAFLAASRELFIDNGTYKISSEINVTEQDYHIVVDPRAKFTNAAFDMGPIAKAIGANPVLAFDGFYKDVTTDYDIYEHVVGRSTFLKADTSGAVMVGQYSNVEGAVSGASVFGANFGVYLTSAGATGVGLEIDVNSTIGGATGTGLAIDAIGSAPAQTAIVIQNNNSASPFNYGISFNNANSPGTIVNNAIQFTGAGTALRYLYAPDTMTFTTALLESNVFIIGPSVGSFNGLLRVDASAAGTPTLSAVGSATNIAILQKTKGTGDHLFQGGDTLSRFVVKGTTGATYLEIAAGSGGATITARGTDTNADIILTGKGSAGANFLDGGGTSKFRLNTTGIGFFATTPAVKQTVTGSRGANAALASLLTALATYGIITDSSS